MQISLPNAFTLIEVLIAISIIALVSVFSIPNFRRFSANQDIASAYTNVVSNLRRAESNAISGIRCTQDVNPGSPNPIPRPPFSFDVQFTSTGMNLSTLCVNNNVGNTQLDFSALPIQDTTTPVFSGSPFYVASQHVSPRLTKYGPVTINGNPYSNTCPDGLGNISFRSSQVFLDCNSPPTNFVLLTNPYYMILHDDRVGVSDDVVISISPTGVIGLIKNQ